MIQSMIVNIVASTAIWAIVAVAMLRVICYAGLWENKSGNKVMNWLLAKKGNFEGDTPTRKEYIRVALGAAGFRVAIYIISAVAMRLYLGDETPVTLNQFLDEWLKWDANNYIRIATLGYQGYEENGLFTTLAFFPLYAWLIKIFHVVISDVRIAALLISTICFVVGACYFYGTIAMEYGRSIAKKSLIYLAVFPFALFQGAMMPESTFFMLCAMCFYYTKKHNWCLAGIMGMLASLSRMHGIILIAVTGAEWLETYQPFAMIKAKKGKELIKNIFTKAIWIPFMLVGFGIYLFINYKVTGNPFQFMVYQKEVWGNGGQYFGKTISDIWNRGIGGDLAGQTRITAGIVPLVLFVLAVVLMFYGIRTIHAKYTLFLVFYVIANFMQCWLISAGRYMTVAFPMFLLMAVFSEKHKEADKWIVTISSVLFGVILYAFLTWKQIL